MGFSVPIPKIRDGEISPAVPIPKFRSAARDPLRSGDPVGAPAPGSRFTTPPLGLRHRSPRQRRLQAISLPQVPARLPISRTRRDAGRALPSVRLGPRCRHPEVRIVCPPHQTGTSTPTRRILLLQVPIPCLWRWAAQAGSRANLDTLTARQPSPARRSRSPWYVREAGIVRLAPSTLMAARRALGKSSPPPTPPIPIGRTPRERRIQDQEYQTLSPLSLISPLDHNPPPTKPTSNKSR